jgi:Kef-type K+ transport system membrane component KefB
VLSFLYIVASVILLAIGTPWSRGGTQPIIWIAFSWIGFFGLSILLGWLPLKLALRRARTFEY